MKDAERLTCDYTRLIAESPFRIAPERQQELYDNVLNKEIWDLVFTTEKANFSAFAAEKKIFVSFSALLSIWAVAHAAHTLSPAAAESMRQGNRIIDVVAGSPLATAFEMIEAAKELIRNENSIWPPHLPVPIMETEEGTANARVNNLFLGAVSWIILHEIAHINLNHEEITSSIIRNKQEHEADIWAVDWIMKQPRDEFQRGFRIFSVSISLCWIGLIDEIRRGSTSHPHASERFGACIDSFNAQPLDYGVESASYLTKILFDPKSTNEDAEDPADALRTVVINYIRSPR
ncbi:MAG: hypothetical protein K0Q54_3439 [Methylobacterium brachiatum]|jgi:hypothetical protein|nr:hypothetical protein [Methylobacterium brachiatum]